MHVYMCACACDLKKTYIFYLILYLEKQHALMMADVYVWVYACTWNWIGFQAREQNKMNYDELTNQ